MIADCKLEIAYCYAASSTRKWRCPSPSNDNRVWRLRVRRFMRDLQVSFVIHCDSLRPLCFIPKPKRQLALCRCGYSNPAIYHSPFTIYRSERQPK